MGNQYYNKFHHQRNCVCLTVRLVVEFFENIDFQRRYDTFSETPVQIILLHSVLYRCLHLLSVQTRDDLKQGNTKNKILKKHDFFCSLLLVDNNQIILILQNDLKIKMYSKIWLILLVDNIEIIFILFCRMI